MCIRDRSTHIKELGSDINLITLIPSPQRNSISNALGEVANIVDKVETVIDWLDKLRDFIDGLRNGGEIRISLEWKPELKSFPSSKPIFICLLYTSDAADERSSVDLGGRRIIKKKKKNKIDVEWYILKINTRHYTIEIYEKRQQSKR